MSKLPQPSPAQQARSSQLVAQIRQTIAQNSGWIPFDDYMNAALYTPNLGYYASELSPFSMRAAQGDFVTAPLLTPLFGACLAQQAIEVFERTGAPQILEIGAGTGKLAADILNHLAQLNTPATYFILELSATLRAEQQATIAQIAPHAAAHVTWLDTLPTDFDGFIIGNEVLDAMPVKLIGIKDGAWFERGVAWHNEQLIFADRPTTQTLPMNDEWRAALQTSHSGYLSETHAQQIGFMTSLAHALRKGVIVMIDYGFPAHEFYHPQRSTGTLMCHIQHVAHADPLYYAGVQDITAHVNFSALAHINGLHTLGYVSQANFLINNGLLDFIPQQPDPRLAANRALRLMSEAEMGELFKVMAWHKGLDFSDDDTLQGFTRGDRLASL